MTEPIDFASIGGRRIKPPPQAGTPDLQEVERAELEQHRQELNQRRGELVADRQQFEKEKAELEAQQQRWREQAVEAAQKAKAMAPVTLEPLMPGDVAERTYMRLKREQMERERQAAEEATRKQAEEEARIRAAQPQPGQFGVWRNGRWIPLAPAPTATTSQTSTVQGADYNEQRRSAEKTAQEELSARQSAHKAQSEERAPETPLQRAARLERERISEAWTQRRRARQGQ